MKHNLKTIKKLFRTQAPYDSSDFALEHEITQFEAELREMCYALGADGRCYVPKEEILGE